jgi:hypothetical protein
MKTYFAIMSFAVALFFYSADIQAQCSPSWLPSGHQLPLGSSSSPLHSAWLHQGLTPHTNYSEEDICMPVTPTSARIKQKRLAQECRVGLCVGFLCPAI